MGKKIKDMTDEEINEEFERQYKRDYLKAKEYEKKRRKIGAILLTICIITAVICFIRMNIALSNGM